MVRVKWFPGEDFLSLGINELNVAKKNRRSKPSQYNIIPSKKTRRGSVSKATYIFKINDITATMKLDIHNLIERGFD